MTMSRKSSVAETIRANRAAPKPGESVQVTPDGSTTAVPAEVLRVNRGSIVVKLEQDCRSASGDLLFAAGASVHIPRHPAPANDAAEAPGRAYVAPDNPPPAPTPASKPSLATLKSGALETLLAQRSRLAALQAEASALATQLHAAEQAVIAAWKAGARAPEGFAVLVQSSTSSSVSPSWKSEALALAVQCGKDPAAYEQEVRARTKPSVKTTETLLVERQ